jgi:membrane protease YdiL (CAAX protease family)
MPGAWWVNPEFLYRRLVALPTLLLCVPVLNGFRPLEPETAAVLVFGHVLVGFGEEALFRGVVLRTLLPGGAPRATLLSSVLFAGVHLIRPLLGAEVPSTLYQVGGATCFGVAMAAVTLRTHTIWPAMGIHALSNVLGALSQLPPVLDLGASVTANLLLLGYGLYLLRDRLPPHDRRPVRARPSARRGLVAR